LRLSLEASACLRSSEIRVINEDCECEGHKLVFTEWNLHVRMNARLPLQLVMAMCLFAVSNPGRATGTPAGTVIDNVAIVNFEIGGISGTQNSNTVTMTVLERLDVIVTLQSPQVLVASSQANRSLLFTLTNTGNGNDEFELFIDSTLTGDDFDPVPATPAIYYDTDASGDFTAGDVAYVPAGNNPQLAADESVDMLLVNDMPPVLTDGWLGRSQLTATTTAGTGLPGESLAGQGDGGLDAVLGASGGTAAALGEYLVSDVAVSVQKSVLVSDPFGGTEATTGATLTYTISVEVMNSGTASASVFTDPIPQFSTYVADSLLLNGASLTDAIDADVGELDTSGPPAVVVRLGDLTQASGIQTIEFKATID
jgi:uncharacterized repeat protein (TIGR01451 family)